MKLKYHLSQLRHAYQHLSAERVKNQKQFADGLISPAIAAFEKHLNDVDNLELALNEAIDMIEDMIAKMDYVGTGDSASAAIEQNQDKERLEKIRAVLK